MKIRNLLPFVLVTLVAGCIEPFNPPVPSSGGNFLVVEGITVNDLNESIVRLSRSQNLDDESDIIYEEDASVSVVSVDPENPESGSLQTYSFSYVENGYYIADIDWDQVQNCKLRIQTADGKMYESEMTKVKKAPEIDSISWKADDEGLHFYVNTHDDMNNTWYYRWEYIETIQFHSRFESISKWDTALDQVLPRIADEDKIFYCWTSNSSGEILIGTSRDLDRDLINGHQILTLPPESWKHSYKYSLLVKQYALTREAYDYIYNVEKSNEEIGSLFDPQPVNIKGNISCITEPLEPVIGFFTVSNLTQKRIFVSASQLPNNWWGLRQSSYNRCQVQDTDTIPASDLNDTIMEDKLIIGYNLGTDEYYLFDPICVDCRMQNRGKNIKPDFWE